jgi:hypothetical protein
VNCWVHVQRSRRLREQVVGLTSFGNSPETTGRPLSVVCLFVSTAYVKQRRLRHVRITGIDRKKLYISRRA